MKEPFFKRLTTSFSALDRLSKIFVVAFLVAALATAVVAFSFVRQFIVTTTSFQLPGIAIQAQTTNEAGELVDVAPQMPSGFSPDPWDGSSRVNILVMGLDYRDWSAGEGPARTDSMMLFTFDPVSKTAGMLSIPRDLWVEIPGFGHDKINTAYFLGEGAQLPGGGAGLAVKTVEQFLGVKINYYAQIDFGAFERFIDTIGGVKIELDPDEHIRVQLIGEEGTRVIDGGRQTLNGAYALAYARARHTEDGDFARANRQQEIILAIRNQMLRPEVTAMLLTHGFQIYQDLSSGVNTNMSIDEMFSLAWAMKDINDWEITQAIIAPEACNLPGCVGEDYVTLGTSPDGLSILKPLTENIRILRDHVFSTGSVRSVAAVNTESSQLMLAEAAQISVNNGSGVAGLAESTSAFLQNKGFMVASVGNADVVSATTLIDYTGNPYTLQYLVELMGVSPTHIFSRYDPASQIDVEVIVGPNWTVPAN
jgi:LCP family protein required for cell wall assembly